MQKILCAKQAACMKRHVTWYTDRCPGAVTVTNQHLLAVLGGMQRLVRQHSALSEPEPDTDVASLVALLTTLRP